LELIAAIETTTCPVCNESFPSTKIHRHAATCLDQFQSGPRNSLSRTASSSTAQPLSSKLASKREACVSSDILSDFKGAKCPICHQALRARR
jgi:RNA polymerase subunit RPABC4/transcription elongation factor Spt4